MAEKIIISPNTKEIAITAQALSMKNDLVGSGLSFPEFVGAMKLENPEYLSTKGKAKLKSWWNIRLKDERLNLQVEKLIHKLNNV